MLEDDTRKEYANGVSNQFLDGNLQKKQTLALDVKCLGLATSRDKQL